MHSVQIRSTRADFSLSQIIAQEVCSEIGDHVAIAYSTSSEDDVDDVSILEETTAPLCDGTPRRLWVGKCVVLHRADGFPIARGICRNVSSDIVIGSSGPLGESHVAIQIFSSLSKADVPNE